MSRSSPNVRRIAAILSFVAERRDQAFTLSDLIRALHISRATCHSLLTSLVDVGYLSRNSDKQYVIGPAMETICRVAAAYASPLQIARPEMRILADEFEGVCSAIFLDGADCVIRERAALVHNLDSATTVGTRLRLRAPFSAIYFAWSCEDGNAWLATAKPPATPEQTAAMFGAMTFVQQHGFMFNVVNPVAPSTTSPETLWAEAYQFPVRAGIELLPGQEYQLASITAPVFDGPGHVAFVLSIMGMDRRVRGDTIERMGKRLREACDRVTGFIAGAQVLCRPADLSHS